MLDEILPVLKHFRDRLYRFFPSRRDAAIELVDAISSNRTARSVVELSLSSLHRRNYCSITRVLDEFISQDPAIASAQKQTLTNLLSSVCPPLQIRKFHLFAIDCTPEPRVKNNDNQVHISRTRNNKKFYYPFHQDRTTMLSKRGRPTVYGDLHQLNEPTTWHFPDEHIEFSQPSRAGKMLHIKIDAWDEVIMRSKKGTKLSDYPLRLLRVQVFKASGELLFKRPLWLTVAGKRRMELSLFDIYSSYRQRFDIEHFFRFGKTRLLIDKIQTPDVGHEEAWWQLVMIAYTQLYLSRSIAANLPNPWERHLPSFKQSETIKQPTVVQKDFERIIRMIGTPAQPPKPRKNAPGRQLGDTQVKRIRHPVVKKYKNTAVTEKMIA